jgi:hypothetical protein
LSEASLVVIEDKIVEAAQKTATAEPELVALVPLARALVYSKHRLTQVKNPLNLRLLFSLNLLMFL